MADTKVLIVDDSNYSRKLISEMLEGSEYTIVGEAANATEALNSLKGGKIDIMIIDIVMPGMSGLELARNVLKLKKNMHIIMISSLSGENIVVDAIKVGASDFLPKPISEEHLKTSLDKIRSAIQLEA